MGGWVSGILGLVLVSELGAEVKVSLPGLSI